MKKHLSLLLVLLLLVSCFTACEPKSPVDPNTTPQGDPTVRIGYFSGTTGIGMAKMISDADPAYSFTKYEGTTYIAAALQNGELDIAAYPTQGVPALDNTVEGGVQYLAINTLGVLYLCTNGIMLSSLSELSGKTVYVPEPAPGKVLEYILAQNGITDVNIQMSSLTALPELIVSGENDVQIALLPEPKVTAAQLSAQSAGNTSFAVSPIDLTEEWNKVSDTPLVQGCVVVRSDFAAAHPDLVERFLSVYRASISYIANAENLESAAEMVVNAGILPKAAIAKIAIPRSNITYLAGEDMRQAVTGFLTAFGSDYRSEGYYLPKS